jgi:hypothetical protein
MVRERVGDPEVFLREGGLLRFKRLLQSDDDVEQSYPEVKLHSRSDPEDYLIQDERDLDAEISRVRTKILRVLRHNAYRGKKRTPKADLVAAVCTEDSVLDRTLTVLEQRGLIKGALSGQIKITGQGEAELENVPTDTARAVPAARAARVAVMADRYDVFISHASEDKDAFVRPLAESLVQKGLKVWYDEFTLKLGDSLRASIDKGLATSRFGVVILSHRFFAKKWPQKELNGLFALMRPEQRKVLPIWHEISEAELAAYSPMLVDLVAARSSEGVEAVVKKILEVVKG